MAQPPLGQVCWTELLTTNLEKSKDFYGDIFGWKFKEVITNDVPYTIIQANGNEIAGMWHNPKNPTESSWLSYILVLNVKESLEKAKKLGATELVGVTKAGEMGQFAVILDPTGAKVAFWEAAVWK